MAKIPTKNRGAGINPEGRFELYKSEEFDDGWDLMEEEKNPIETTFFPEPAKSIISYNDSPDIGFNQSINPYRGCEHGCIYCYARPSHAYVNLSPGIDFETKIFYKQDAAQLLEKEINKPRYKCQTIVIGANTDPYQPAEAKFKITRSLLEVFKRYRHPVSLITKNAMIERDIDLLAELAQDKLAQVAISVTSMSRSLKHILEPRTSTPQARLKVIQKLRENNIPVRVMLAPIIPMLNDMEMEKILQAVSEAGAQHASYVLIRLPYEVKDLFKDWLTRHYPQRAEHIMSLIKQMRGGKEYDSTFGKRMRGEGNFAQLIETRFRLACKRFNLNKIPAAPLNYELFKKKNSTSGQQLSLWLEDDF